MDYRAYIEANRDQEIEALQKLVSIDSVVSDSVTTAEGVYLPFGRGVQDAFVYFLELAASFGFETENIDNYGGHADFGHGSETVGILGHLDVVPAGDGWAFDPFSGAVSDGYIYGRGVQDDKGPMIAALFAMKALKDAGYEPSKKVRMILGLDEETAWNGMKYYFDRVEKPDFGFTPDGDFPAIYGEKGMVTFEIAKKFPKNADEGLMLRSLNGGDAPNMVPERARAVISSSDSGIYPEIKEMAAAFRKETGYKVHVKGIGRSLEIISEGKAAHGATPEAGLNAVSVMMAFLGRLNFAGDELNVFLDFYNRYIGFDLNGEKLGCGFSDDPSGALTLNVGLVHYDRESAAVTVNVRYPVTYSEEQVYEAIMPLLDQYGMGLVKCESKPSVYMEPNSPMVRTLVEVYRENTGDLVTEPLVIGGGTYAKAADHIVAFGGLFPGDEDLMHQRDERLSLDRLMKMTEIYADAIFRLTQKGFAITEEQ